MPVKIKMRTSFSVIVCTYTSLSRISCSRASNRSTAHNHTLSD